MLSVNVACYHQEHKSKFSSWMRWLQAPEHLPARRSKPRPMAKRPRTEEQAASASPQSAYVFDSSTDTNWLAQMTAALQAQQADSARGSSSGTANPDARVRTYVSQPNHKEMKVHKWREDSWICGFCSVEWSLFDTGAPDNAGVTCQIAHANGGQLRMWLEGLQGMCKYCDTCGI